MELRNVSLVKGGHRYIFRYSGGSEAQIIDAFIGLADDSDSDFDWFDAAVLSYQLGKQLDEDMETVDTPAPS